jgi:hypothetical protein
MIDLTCDHLSKRYRVRSTADANRGRRSLKQKLQTLRSTERRRHGCGKSIPQSLVYYRSRWNEIDKRLVFGRPRWLWKRVVEAELKCRLHRMLSSPEVWVEHLITSSKSWGLLNGDTPKARV